MSNCFLGKKHKSASIHTTDENVPCENSLTSGVLVSEGVVSFGFSSGSSSSSVVLQRYRERKEYLCG